jgi:hypothetical protein
VPFYAFPPDMRRILYTTNSIEALNSKLRRAVRARGQLPSDEAAAKLLFLVLNRTEKSGGCRLVNGRWPRLSLPSCSASASCGQWLDKCQPARPHTKSLIVPRPALSGNRPSCALHDPGEFTGLKLVRLHRRFNCRVGRAERKCWAPHPGAMTLD